MAAVQAGLPNFRDSFPQPMIFWNALRRTALCAQVACVINKTERGEASGDTFEQTPDRAVPACASTHTFYGQKTSFAEQTFAEKILASQRAEFFWEIAAEKSDARGARVGGRDDEENVHRRKGGAALIYDLSRNIYRDGFSGVSADAALRERFARRRIHHRDAHRTAGNREEPSISDRGVEQRTASEGEDSAAGRRGFRARLGDAPR